MQGELQCLVGRGVILKSLQEVKTEIRDNGVCSCEQASLLHQLGSLYGLLGKTEKQKQAWQNAQTLDPNNQMILSSLESLQR